MTKKSKKLLVIGTCVLAEVALGCGAYFLLKDLFIAGLAAGIAYCNVIDFFKVAGEED